MSQQYIPCCPFTKLEPNITIDNKTQINVNFILTKYFTKCQKPMSVLYVIIANYFQIAASLFGK